MTSVDESGLVWPVIDVFCESCTTHGVNMMEKMEMGMSFFLKVFNLFFLNYGREDKKSRGERVHFLSPL